MVSEVPRNHTTLQTQHSPAVPKTRNGLRSKYTAALALLASFAGGVIAGKVSGAEPDPEKQVQVDLTKYSFLQLESLLNDYTSNDKAIYAEMNARINVMKHDELEERMGSELFPVRQMATTKYIQQAIDEGMKTQQIPNWIHYEGDDPEIRFRVKIAEDTVRKELALMGKSYTPPPERAKDTDRTLQNDLEDFAKKTGYKVHFDAAASAVKNKVDVTRNNDTQTSWEFIRGALGSKEVADSGISIYGNGEPMYFILDAPSSPYYTGSTGGVFVGMQPSYFYCCEQYKANFVLEPSMILHNWEVESVIGKRENNSTFHIYVERAFGRGGEELELGTIRVPETDDKSEFIDITVTVNIAGCVPVPGEEREIPFKRKVTLQIEGVEITK